MTPRARRAAWISLPLLLVLAGLAAWLLRSRPPRLTLAAVAYDALPGWTADHTAAVLPAVLRSCARLAARPDDAALDAKTHSENFGRVADWRTACAAAASVAGNDDVATRSFFATQFAPFLAGNNGESDGLFTGYCELTVRGSWRRGGPYQTPLYRRPPDPARYTRAEIDDGALAGRGLELLWLASPVEAFFLALQGSGRVRLPDGKIVRVGYDGQNGRSYVPVGRLLIERGEIARDKVTMAVIRAWMVAHPKAGAALRREDPSYVFFREVAGDGAVGAERTELTAGRSLAVDRRFVPLGVPIWLDLQERYSAQTLRRLVVAQDAGGAIRGPVRGDLFWGYGKDAEAGAGAMNARGKYYLLLPRAIAARLR